MPVTNKVTVIDKGWNRIVAELKKAANSFTKVGLPQEGELKGGTRTGSGREPLVEFSQLVTVGAVHEFGAPSRNIPERPFLRTSFDESKGQINLMIEKEYDRILRGSADVAQSLGRVGVFLKGKIQKKIVDIKSPPNAPKTIERKGSSNPLIDTGQLRQSIQHVEVIVG